MAHAFCLHLSSALGFRPSGKKYKQSNVPLEVQEQLQAIQPAKIVEMVHSPTKRQSFSTFMDRLPLEIRSIIYHHVWQGRYDHNYDIPLGRHLSFERGRWRSTRCVMLEQLDEDLDAIQKQMDEHYENEKREKLRMWHMTLKSSWGCRHWRCEKHLRDSSAHNPGNPHADLSSMMVVCKQMYPEVMQSYFESHKFMLNNVLSAHEFLVGNPNPFVRHIRDLDVTFNMGQYHYQPFMKPSDKLDDQPQHLPLASNTSWVREIWDSLDNMICLHNLRISFDTYDRGAWRKIPERSITDGLRTLQVQGQFTIELPPSLPIHAPKMQGHLLDERQENLPFHVIRRPALRYWAFKPGNIERFAWETSDDSETGLPCSSIAVFKNSTFVQSSQAPYNNPHIGDP